MKSSGLRLVLLVALFGAASAFAGPKLWLDETFADGERTLQTPPVSLAWLTGSSGSTLNAAKGALTQAGGGRHVLAYFAPKETPLYLEAGCTAVLTYQISLYGPKDASGTLRVGLFHSGGARIAGDREGRSEHFRQYIGYMCATNPVPARPPAARLYRRTEGVDALIGDLNAFVSIAEPAGGLHPLKDGVIYTGTLTIRRSESGHSQTITHALSGGDISGPYEVSTVDSNDPVSAFDTVVFHTGTKGADGFTLHSVRIETRKG
jgi:hypothetical protein